MSFRLGAKLSAPPPGLGQAGGGMMVHGLVRPGVGLINGIVEGGVAPPAGTTPPPANPATPAAPFKLYGSGYTGLGDGDNGRAAGVYGWLDDEIKAKATADKSYQLLAGEGQSVKLGEYLDAFKATDGRYVIKPAYTERRGKGESGPMHAAVYGSRDDMRRALGFEGAADDISVGFSDAHSGGGDAGGGVLSAADALVKAKLRATGGLGTANMSVQQARALGGNYDLPKAYQAGSDAQYKGYVQLGNQGPLNDDINSMLPAIYLEVGASTLEQQKLVRGALFKYDDRYGVMANEHLVLAALGKNKNRSKGWLQDLVKFEAFNFKKMMGQVKDNPARLLYGSADPFSTKAWNGVLGTDDKPILNQMGGASDEAWKEAAAKGINTKAAAGMHTLASVIASFYGAKGIAGAAGGGTVGNAASKLAIQAAQNNGKVDLVGLITSMLGNQLTQGLSNGISGAINTTDFGQALLSNGVNAGQLAGNAAGNLVLGKKVDPLALGLQAGVGLVGNWMKGKG